MDIAKKTEGGRTVISVTGRVDTTTAPEGVLLPKF